MNEPSILAVPAQDCDPETLVALGRNGYRVGGTLINGNIVFVRSAAVRERTGGPPAGPGPAGAPPEPANGPAADVDRRDLIPSG